MESKFRFIKLSNDTTIKYIYKNNKEFLNNLIKESLGIDLTGFKEGSNELPGGNNLNKNMKMDFYLENDNYDVVIIEVQNSRIDADKNYLYLYRVAGYGIKKDESYSNYTKGVKTLICINNYIPYDDNGKPIDSFIVELRHGNDSLNYHIKNIKSYEIILPNLKKIDYTNLNETERDWYLFLCNNYEEMEHIATSKESKKVIDTLKGLSMDDDFLLSYDHEEVYKAMAAGAKKEGIKEGIEQGEKKKQLEIAKNLLKLEIPVDKIIIATGLTKEEIDNL